MPNTGRLEETGAASPGAGDGRVGDAGPPHAAAAALMNRTAAVLDHIVVAAHIIIPPLMHEVAMTLQTSRMPVTVCAVAALVLAGSSSRLAAQPPASMRFASDADVQGAVRLFSAWLEGQMLERGLPGVAVGVVADQELVWSAGFGFANSAARIPMTPQTKFRMASHSKLFTATAVMQLREQGKVRLDDPVSKYLPWFRVKPAESDDPPITIEELLTHSSGLPREAGAHWTTFEFPTTDQLRELMPARVAPFAPEVRWKYSNLAYSVAGMIVEAVSGQTWADY